MNLLIFLLLFVAPVGSQTLRPGQINPEMRKAARLEAQNDLAGAQRIYLQLYVQYPARGDLVLRLQNIYSRTGQHDKAVTLLRQHLQRSPNNITTLLKLGDALFALGKPEEAFAEWEKLFKHASTPNTFSLVASRYLKYSIYDRASAAYHRARRELKTPDLFARELAELAERQTHYADAVREYLVFLRQKPQYRTTVEARLRDMAHNGEQHDEIFALLAAQVVQSPDKLGNLGLLIEYALPAGYAAQVLNLVQDTPNLPANSWTYLSRIARYALDEDHFETAALAYQSLYDRVDRPDVQARALIGLAHTKHRAQQIEQARHYYRAVIDAFPLRPESDEARFHTGLFLRDIDHDVEHAQKSFQEVIDSSRKTEWRYRAFFELAEGYVQTNRFEGAEKIWATILSERKVGPDVAQARFNMAEIQYYRGDFDMAKILLNAILVKDLAQNFGNDAILKLALIVEGEQNDAGQLRQYAHAELLARQQDLENAYLAFGQLQERHPQTFLADRILHKQAELLELLQRYTEAIQHHRKLVSTLKTSPLCAASQLALAEIYETRLGQYHEAERAYEKLLVDFPLSFEADLARERLRTLQQKIQSIDTPKETG
jgi:tetratricopeptide (TPR) repeat protein